MNTVAKLWLTLLSVLFVVSAVFFVLPDSTFARYNIRQYSDTISDSAPQAMANHTFRFLLDADVSPGGRLEITPPAGFEVISASTFDVRNVELWVNGFPRTASTTASPGVDMVEITSGSPGFIRYTLAPDFSIVAGSQIELRIGNNTSNSFVFSESYSSTTGTTTVQADVEPIKNSATLGRHDVHFEVWDGGLEAETDFIIFLNQRVSMPGIDTTETVPPFRFNPAPTSTVGGTTLSVEISLETDEFAICKYDRVSGTSYSAMPYTFDNTGLIFHSEVVAVTPSSIQQFYVRCLDDEGNFNTDDFTIVFTVNDTPTGQANTEGSTSGDGTGSGNSGAGTGSGAGGEEGDSDGEAPFLGGSAGTGGSGGGGGGGRGGDTGSTAGGGFESDDAPYRSGDARVIISGYAFPNSTVTFLVDGDIAETTRSNSSGAYEVTLDAIAKGVYTFGVYGEGPDKVKSSTFSTSFTVVGGRTSELTNINVSPSVKVSPDPVQPGQTLTVSGYGLPNSTVTLQYGTQKSKMQTETTTQADGSGKWTTTISTNGFSKGTYKVRAKSVRASDGMATNYSEYTFFGVGEASEVKSNADLSRDGRVNLTDFSILLFWWGTNGGDSNPPADINRDTKVNLTDFSILLFNWTG
ncbi:MAG: hypothetical protein RLZZ480_95 [Candidatus Parcubacteria bacterium]|jgi:hypothetical protein